MLSIWRIEFVIIRAKHLLKKCLNILLVKIPLFFHRFFNTTKNISIISRDCIGGVLYNQLNMKFFSPTINLFLDLEEFNLFCIHLPKYIESELVECQSENEYGCPSGYIEPSTYNLKPIKIYFLHYPSFELARQKWNERKKRILWNDIYIIDSCAYERELKQVNEKIISDFNEIPYKKVIFVPFSIGFDDEFVVKPHNETWPYLLYNRWYTWKRPFNKFNFSRFLKHSLLTGIIKYE